MTAPPVPPVRPLPASAASAPPHGGVRVPGDGSIGHRASMSAVLAADAVREMEGRGGNRCRGPDDVLDVGGSAIAACLPLGAADRRPMPIDDASGVGAWFPASCFR